MRRSRIWARCALVVGALSACTAAPPAERTAPIIGGTYTTGDPATVALLDEGGHVICSGVLVSGQVVATAAHCLGFGTPRYVFFGSDPAVDGTFREVIAAEAHPGFDSTYPGPDVGVVVLAAPAPAEPVALAIAPPAVGETVRFVGFGYTEVGPAGDYGRKYERVADVTAVEELVFRYGVATCAGDSGGPAFASGDGGDVLVGLTSFGDAPCAVHGADVRVDVFRGWLEEMIALHDRPPTCDDDGRCASGCMAPDPDCPCAADGLCGDACAPPAVDPDCAPTCAADGRCASGCPAWDPDCPATPLEEPCATDDECGAGAVCDDVCRRRCDAEADVCGEEERCREVAAGVRACVPADDGCAVAPAGRRGAAGGALAGLLLGLAVVGRRRGRAERGRRPLSGAS